MAYEKMDKQALATMARDYERKSKPKVGFWGGLFASFGNAERSIFVTPNRKKQSIRENFSYSKSDYEYVSNNDSPNLMGGWIRYDNNYSPNVGSDDWD